MAGGRGTAARLIRRLTTARPIARPPAPRVAFVSPLPPARTGIATYARSVLDGLDRIGYRGRREVDAIWPVQPRHEVEIRGYRLGVYHLGNNAEFHADIYRLAVSHPGLVVLHDLGLDDFVRGLVSRGDPLGYRAYREAVLRAGRMTLPEVRLHEPLARPWCAHIARHARGVIVHSEFGRRYLEDFGCRTPVFVVPHPPVEREADLRRAEPLGRALRTRLGLGDDGVLVVAPGDLNRPKQLDALLEAVGRLRPSTRVHVGLVGRRIPGYDAGEAVAASGLSDATTVATDVSDEEFRAWLLAADVVVDLRHPHRGEVSGSLVRAMQAGRPAVVSATGTYLDLPEDAVVRIAPGPADPDELATAIARLARDRDLRLAIGRRAREHVERTAGEERTARGYERAIEATLRLVMDPRRMALARWARALNDLGITEAHLDEGFGVGYARGLDELAAAIPRERG